MQKKRWLNGLLAGLAIASGLAVALPLIRQQAAPSDVTPTHAIGSEFCATSAPEARVRPGDKIDRRYGAAVPLDTPPPGMPSLETAHAITQGDVVQFEVASPRSGQVAVHGLYDAQTLQVGGVVRVAFRAVYSGRFPLHFHGADGSHFEIAAVEVLPASMALAREKDQ